MQLVDQCWTNQPLSPVELQLLQGIRSFTQALAPGLYVRVHLLETGSSQLQHYLWDAASDSSSSSSSSSPNGSVTKAAKRLPVINHDAASFYMQEAATVYPGGWSMNPRMRLKPAEEKRVLQTASRGFTSGQAASTKAASWQSLGFLRQIDASVPSCPVAASYISSREEELQELVLEGDRSSSSSKSLGGERAAKVAKTAAGGGSKGSAGPVLAYPLKPCQDRGVGRGAAEGPMPLEKEMHQELKHSWEVYNKTPKSVKVLPEIKEVVMTLQVWLSQVLLVCWLLVAKASAPS